MIDYSKYETTPAIPEASSMIETFRAIGYSLEGAIADIIDNSISANAKNVYVDFDWKGEDTWISIKDDGKGMNNEELVQAMRPGSRNPLDDRGSKDLGRFGLGLKTASFSQCRKLSVVSKKEKYNSVFWTWDLDFVNQTGKWDLIKYLPNEEKTKLELELLNSGTIVIWNDVDRLVKNLQKNDKNAFEKFLQIMLQVKKHLAMVFHRFIEGNRIKIHYQGRLIDPWNPFLVNEPSTQGFPEEPLNNGKILVKGFVLPHKSKITDDKFREAEGPKGWNAQQGFYIYRNDRMLLAGDWLSMFRQEEHYKLARIEISLPNSLDSEWQIDIKKSIARPPIILRDQLKAYASKVRGQAVEVYRHKGKNLKPFGTHAFVPLWIDHKRGDKWFYKINRNHPLIENVRDQCDDSIKRDVEILLRFIEETIPIKSIYIKEAEESEGQGKPFENGNHKEVQLLMKTIFDSLIRQGRTKDEAQSVLVNLDPFHHYPEYISLIE